MGARIRNLVSKVQRATKELVPRSSNAKGGAPRKHAASLLKGFRKQKRSEMRKFVRHYK